LIWDHGEKPNQNCLEKQLSKELKEIFLMKNNIFMQLDILLVDFYDKDSL